MTEKELREENERLRHELAVTREDRDQLHKWVCSMIPIDRTEISPEEFEELARKARPVDEVLREMLPQDLHSLISESNGKS